MIERGVHSNSGECLGSFMIIRPTLSCSLWLEFVYTEYCHDVIYVQTFNDATSYLWLVKSHLGDWIRGGMGVHNICQIYHGSFMISRPTSSVGWNLFITKYCHDVIICTCQHCERSTL